MVADGNSPYSLFNIESNIILKSEKEKGDNVNVWYADFAEPLE